MKWPTQKNNGQKHFCNQNSSWCDVNIDDQTEAVMQAFKWEVELKPRIEIPRLIIRHLVLYHMCKDGWTHPYCHAWPKFYFEVFEDRRPVFKYVTDDGNSFVWQIINWDNMDIRHGYYIGVWPD